MKSITVLQNCFHPEKLNQQQSGCLHRLQEVMQVFQQLNVLQASQSLGDSPDYHCESLELLSSSQLCSDFWLNTSGYHFSQAKAEALKKAGLVGIILNLNHFDPELHNQRQGYKHAFGWVLKAADAARKAGLLLCFRLSPTPDFISMHNLLSYARFARKLGVSLIQITEKDDKGRLMIHKYSLQAHHLLILDDFIETLNYDDNFRNWPVVSMEVYGEPLSTKITLGINESGKLQSLH